MSTVKFSISSFAICEANFDEPQWAGNPYHLGARELWSNRHTTRFEAEPAVALEILHSMIDTPAYDTSGFGGEPADSYRFRAAVKRLARSLARQGVDASDLIMVTP